MDSTTPTLNFWPLVVVIEDVHVPELAPAVLDAVVDLDSETVATILAVARIQAGFDALSRTN